MRKKISVLICFVLLLVSVTGCGFLVETKPEVSVQPEVSVGDVSINEEELIVESLEEAEASEEKVEIQPITPAEVVIATITDGSAQGYFATTDIDGNEVTQEIFTQSKLTVVNVWATYCGPCIREIPHLVELSDEYDAEEMQIVGIVLDATDETNVGYARVTIEDKNVDYINLLPSEDLYDWGLDDIQYVPTTFFVNSEGKIIDTVVGSMDKGTWKTLIDEKLASL